jgi:hypothetical protein
MAKLTGEDIALTSITSATFSDGKWFILVTDSNNIIYNVSFDGLVLDSNEIILSNTYTALLDVDKYEEPNLPKEIVNNKVVGRTPSEPER